MGMFDFLTTPVAGLAGDVFTGMLGYSGQQQANETNRQIASENTAFQERMSNTAYQRQVKDMEAAGLNPMLAYMKGGGASTPSGSTATVSSPAAAGVNAYSASASSRKTQAEVPNVEAQTEHEIAKAVKTRAERYLVEAQTHLAATSASEKQAMTNKLEFEAKKISEEIKNIPLEGDRLIALAKNLTAATKTEGFRADQVKWLALKTMVEGDLLSFESKAIEQAGNFGKEFGQFKPAIDVILDAIGVLNNFRGRTSTRTTTFGDGKITSETKGNR